MCAVSKRANVKYTVTIPSHQVNGKTLVLFLSTSMFLHRRYTVSKYSDEDVHVNGIKIIQSINMAPGNVAALGCLTVSPFQILFGKVSNPFTAQ